MEEVTVMNDVQLCGLCGKRPVDPSIRFFGASSFICRTCEHDYHTPASQTSEDLAAHAVQQECMRNRAYERRALNRAEERARRTIPAYAALTGRNMPLVAGHGSLDDNRHTLISSHRR